MTFTRSIQFCALVLALAVPAVLLGQFEAATVLGTIRDASGAVVPHSKVTLENIDTGVALTTNADGAGNYEFVNQVHHYYHRAIKMIERAVTRFTNSWATRM